jgi:hypothetical protein
MRVLSNLLLVPFDKVAAEPKLVSVQMLNNRCAWDHEMQLFICSGCGAACRVCCALLPAQSLLTKQFMVQTLGANAQ